MHEFLYQNLITHEDKNEIIYLCESRVNSQKNIHIFSNLTFITPNHRGIYYLSTIAKILQLYPKAQIHLALSDAHIYHNDYIKGLGIKVSPDHFTKERVNVLYRYLKAFGAKEDQINIYTFSDLWKKIIKDENSNLLITYYNTISNISIEDVVEARIKTFDRVFQFSLDIFFAVILHKLYPELLDGIDIFLGRYEKIKIYEIVRAILYDEGVSKIKRPYLSSFKPSPDLILNGRMPEWNMSLEDIRYIVRNSPCSKEDYLKILDVYKDSFQTFNIFLDGKEKKLSYENCVCIVKEDNESHINDVISSVLDQFLQNRKKIVESSKIDNHLHFNSKEDIIKISHLLKTKNILEILELCDGEHTASQIAKKLKLQKSNASKYLHNLQDLNLIENVDGKMNLIRKRLVIELDT